MPLIFITPAGKHTGQSLGTAALSHVQRQIRIETINAAPAARSPYLNVLQIAFDLNVEHKDVVIYKKI
jgi:hypothetical protein